MKVSAVVFDVDGVLCTGGNFGRHLQLKHGIAGERLDDFFRGPFRECIVGRADLKDVLIPFLETWGWPHGAEAFLRFWFEHERAVDERLLASVAALRGAGVCTAVATNQERHRTAFLRREMRLAETFDAVFASCELGVRKPEPAFFEAVTAALAPGRAGEILFFDDTRENVDAARRAGWRAELYRRFGDYEAALAECGLTCDANPTRCEPPPSAPVREPDFSR